MILKMNEKHLAPQAQQLGEKQWLSWVVDACIPRAAGDEDNNAVATLQHGAMSGICSNRPLITTRTEQPFALS